MADAEARVTSPHGRGITSHGPVGVAVATYLGLTLLLLVLGLQQTGHVFVYAQDDPYIHLSLARTLAEHGVWGIRPDQFASASSSPLWTLLLASLWAAGAHAVWWPLVINLVCGIGILVLADTILRDSVDARGRVIILAALIVVTPLPTLALIGLEHSLQVLLSIAFGWVGARMLASESTNRLPAACALAALLVATRYEGLFLVGAVAALLACRSRFAAASTLVAAALVPVAAYAAYSVAHGGLLVPNSLLMKSLPGRFGTVAEGMAAVLSDWASVFSLFSRPPELALTLTLLLILSRLPALKIEALTRASLLAAMFVIAMLVHACLVKLQWFYRYEAALMAVGVLALGLIVLSDDARRELVDPLLRNAAGTILVVLLMLPLGARALSALAVTPGAMRNVFEQQYQMARFFRAAYPDATIAVNDIGAVAWLSSSAIVDIYGLSTQEVADLKRRRDWDPDRLAGVVARRNVKVVAMYEKVFASLIPPSWTLVGEWRIENNVGVSEDTVGFFAPTPGDVMRLREALDGFAPQLPPTVRYTVAGP